jgi:glycogen synthase
VKILFCSYLFAPSIGGIETVSRILAHEFRALGHEVRLVTQTAGSSSKDDFPLFRKPSSAVLLKLIRWSDLVFHNNISLRYVWPLLFFRRPWVIAHHTWIQRAGGTKLMVDKLKLRLLRFAGNIAISPAISNSLPVPSLVIPDPYEADLFYIRRHIPRTRDLVFVGRLVSDKGVDVLLKAMNQLSGRGLHPSLSIVGYGPERQRLEDCARQFQLNSQVTFYGEMVGPDLAEFLNEHRVMVVPSRWEEPFGVVALEGIACGCAVVGTRGGGLQDAIGPCGCTVPNDDPRALAHALEKLLGDEEVRLQYLLKAEAHLKQHQPATVAQKYIEVFDKALQAE